MDIKSFLTDLQVKYAYDEKLTIALSKIIPSLIDYYGKQYKESILEAISTTSIICCNSNETISIVETKKNLIKDDKKSSIIKENKATESGRYISEPKVVYDNVLKTYIIPKINRYIILSHTYNLDSARGIAALTKELIKLINSYKDEYKIENNLIIRRQGIKEEIKEIVANEQNLTLSLIDEKNAGLEEGIELFFEEQIVSNILNDKYQAFDYKLVKELAFILSERLGLKEDMISSCIEKTLSLKVELDKKESIYNKINDYANQTIILENNKKEKLENNEDISEIKDSLKILIDKISNICINYFKINQNDENSKLKEAI